MIARSVPALSTAIVLAVFVPYSQAASQTGRGLANCNVIVGVGFGGDFGLRGGPIPRRPGTDTP